LEAESGEADFRGALLEIGEHAMPLRVAAGRCRGCRKLTALLIAIWSEHERRSIAETLSPRRLRCACGWCRIVARLREIMGWPKMKQIIEDSVRFRESIPQILLARPAGFMANAEERGALKKSRHCIGLRRPSASP